MTAAGTVGVHLDDSLRDIIDGNRMVAEVTLDAGGRVVAVVWLKEK